MFTQNFNKLNTAVPELSRSQRKKTKKTRSNNAENNAITSQ